MLSVASLLNPVKPEARGARLPSSLSSSLHTSSSTHGSPQLTIQPVSNKKQKMTKDSAIFAKGKIKGEIKFPPFESFDEETMREMQKYQVYPLGKIEESCRHIPYNSEKKSFMEKTGREGFEVFQYIFRVPGDEKDYNVMWDYNIGLVRITPFFKCCKYSKTTPAKMLNLNPGLKEITHSITGGAIAAQGYWMPYDCALAVCTTFCAHIAGALIPIFGPSFPSRCVSPEAPEHGRMIIDSSIIIKATAEAEDYRVQSQNSSSINMLSPKTSCESYSPQQPPLVRSTAGNNNLDRRLRLKRAFEADSLYGTPTDTDGEGNASETSSGDAYLCSPATPVSASSLNLNINHQPIWQSQNTMSHSANSPINNAPSQPQPYKHLTGPSPNPLLSAIPRSTGLMDVPLQDPWSVTSSANKRRVEEIDADDEYEGESSASGNDDKISESGKEREAEGEIGGVEKKAAWLLMNLSVKDGECGAEIGKREEEGPRVKRRRATSM